MNIRSKAIVSFASLLVMCGTAAAQLPDPGLEIVPQRTALVITDPQNDFLSPEGATWGVVGKSVEANNKVANIGSLFKAAKAGGGQGCDSGSSGSRTRWLPGSAGELPLSGQRCSDNQ